MNRVLDSLWKFFSSNKLAIGLFISLAVSTMAGSIVLQRPIAEPGQLERAYSPETLRWLETFGLLDVFHSWWFVLQLALLAVNVTVVSIEMWPRYRNRIEGFRPILGKGDLPDLNAKILHHGSVAELTPVVVELVRRRFRRPQVREEGGRVHVAAESGKFAHLGVYIIHTGIVLILIGGLIGNKKGFEGQISLSPGESTDFYYDRKEEGKKVPLGFEIRCLGARMEKYPDGSPKSYFSDLEIEDRAKLVAKKTIKVNDPLSYKGIYFYQATFGQKPVDEKTAITIAVTDRSSRSSRSSKTLVTDFGRDETLPGGRGTFRVVDYAQNLPLDLEGHVRNLGEAVKLELNEKGQKLRTIWLFKNFPDFDRDARKGSIFFVFQDFQYDYRVENVTGLQVARNPGINVTWIGSALLVGGLLATFLIPHRKLWVVVGEGEVFVAAASHRHPETFARKVKKIVKELTQELSRNSKPCRVSLSEKLSGELRATITA